MDRFKFLIKLQPLQYKSLKPEEKFLELKYNPPSITVEFFKNQITLNNINCFSNEGGDWKPAEVKMTNYILEIKLKEKFIPRRGRINCSLNDNSNWRWFGTQFTIKD